MTHYDDHHQACYTTSHEDEKHWIPQHTAFIRTCRTERGSPTYVQNGERSPSNKCPCVKHTVQPKLCKYYLMPPDRHEELPHLYG